VVNVFEKKFTHYFNTLNQDFIVESPKIENNVQFYAICTKSGNLGFLFVQCGQEILGVKQHHNEYIEQVVRYSSSKTT
jgi:hypothetical protein